MALNPKQFDNILRRRQASVPPTAANLGGQERLIGALDEGLAAELGMRPRIAKLAAPEPQGTVINTSEPLPVRYYERNQSLRDADNLAGRYESSDGAGLADFKPDVMEWRTNPTDPSQGGQLMLHSQYQDKHNPEVVEALKSSSIRYQIDPATGQRNPVTYIPNGSGFDVRPMSRGDYNTRKQRQSIPIQDRQILKTMPPGEKARYDEALAFGDDTSEFYRPIDTSTVPFRNEDFYTVDQSLSHADSIARSGLARGTENIADLNRIPVDALDTAASPNYAGIGQRSILVSDQGRINDQYRQEWGDDIPTSPHLQNKRAFIPASDRLQSAAQWKTQPHPQNVRQLDSGFRQFDPNEVRGYATPRAGNLNASPEYVTPSTSIDPIEELWEKQRPGATPFNSTQDFITPEVLAADAAYQQQLKASEALQNQTERAGLNQLRNRQVEVIAPQPRAELEEWAIPGVYIPPTTAYKQISSADDSWQEPDVIFKKDRLEPYVPKLNATNDDYDWDALDADLAMAHVELDGEYYPLTPSATVKFAGLEFGNNSGDEMFSQPDILTAISSKQRELNSIQAKMNELRSSPTARNSEGEGQYNHLMSRAYQLQSGIETATSAHNKLIGLEPLPEVRVTANRLPQAQGTQDPEIEALYQAGLADRDRRQQQRMQEIGMPVTRPRMVESAVNSAPVVVDVPLTAADAVYKRMKTRSWGTPQSESPQPQVRGIEGSFGRMRSAVPQSMPVGPVDPRFVPDPFANPAISQNNLENSSAFAAPAFQSQPLALPPAHTSDVRDVPVAPPTPLPPPRSAAEAAFRQWQPQADAPIAPRQRPQESPSIPSWAAPAAMAGGAGLIGLGGFTLYHQREQEKQMQKEAELRRAMGRG